MPWTSGVQIQPPEAEHADTAGPLDAPAQLLAELFIGDAAAAISIKLAHPEVNLRAQRRGLVRADGQAHEQPLQLICMCTEGM